MYFALLANVVAATMWMGAIEPERTWLGHHKQFFNGFNARDMQAYFYPREYLNLKPVTFKMMDEPETQKLEQLCAQAVERSDFIVHQMFRDSPNRVEELYDANFLFLPTFAGIVLDGQCGPDAEPILRTYLHKMYTHELFKKAHGHTMIMYSSTEAIGDSLVTRVHRIVKERFRYNLTAFEPVMTKQYGVPEEFTDYMISQTILIDRFYRPTMQYCQLFAPLILQNPSSLAAPASSEIKVPTLSVWRAERPIDFLMLDELIVDDPKYAARQAAFQALPDKFPGVYKVVQTHNAKGPFASDCVTPESTKCAIKVDDFIKARNHTLELRKELLAKTKFAIVTRGWYPHEDLLYQAIEGGAIIINTIDKTIDMAAPFQCQVPWEEFTLRIGQERFKRDPVASLKEVMDKLDDEKLLKMIKIQFYFRPDLLYNPGYGQNNRWVDNVLLNAVRRCTMEQVVGQLGFSGLDTQCPFTDWAKNQLVMRTVFNVDLPPWHEM